MRKVISSIRMRRVRALQLLIEIAHAHPGVAGRLAAKRPLLKHAISQSFGQLERALAAEEKKVRTQDKAY